MVRTVEVRISIEAVLSDRASEVLHGMVECMLFRTRLERVEDVILVSHDSTQNISLHKVILKANHLVLIDVNLLL